MNTTLNIHITSWVLTSILYVAHETPNTHPETERGTTAPRGPCPATDTTQSRVVPTKSKPGTKQTLQRAEKYIKASVFVIREPR
jgi:hypothetical protein